jgi:integrase
MKAVLTDALIRGLKAPERGRLEVFDLRSPGLALRVTTAGVKSFRVRLRDRETGEFARETFGRYPDVTLAQARARADEFRRRIVALDNPVKARKRAKEEASTKTFDALAERFMAEYSRRRKRSAAGDERILKLHVLPQWRKRRFDEITRADVIALAERLIGEGKHALANRAQALVSTIFTFGMDAGLVAANPCARLRKRGTERPRDRVLSDDEIRLLWSADFGSSVAGQRVGLALRFALLTAARIGEVAGAQKAEFEALDDPACAAWLIPAARSKNNRARLVPLSPSAREIVLKIIALSPDPVLLFPSGRREAPLTAQAFASALNRFTRLLSGEGPAVRSWKAVPPRSHDGRRTVATRLSAMGFSREDRKAVLGHVESDVHGKHYDLHDRAPQKRVCLNAWAQALQVILLQGEPGGNVLPLRARSAK